MPPRAGPKCIECHKTESMLWRNHEQGQICQECFEQKEKQQPETNAESLEQQKSKDEKPKDPKDKESRDSNGSSTTAAATEQKTTAATNEEKRLRKSTRATRFKTKSAGVFATTANGHTNGTGIGGGSSGGSGSIGGGKSQTKGRNRRNLFKKTPFKTPVAQATTHSVESVFHKGSYLQVGDIVSLVDNQHNVYYAQIRGLLVDNYCEKSAFLTWLIPTQASPDPKEGFDAATYLIGPDEELSRKLSCLEFVMHAPSNYYLDRTTPFPLPDSMEPDTKQGGYIWTTLPEFERKKAIC